MSLTQIDFMENEIQEGLFIFKLTFCLQAVLHQTREALCVLITLA